MATLEEMATEWASGSPYAKDEPREDTNVGSVTIKGSDTSESRMITGVGTKQEAPRAQPSTSAVLRPAADAITNSNLQLESSQNLFTNLDKQLEIIRSGDTKAGALALAEAKSSIATTQARFYKEAQTTAMAEFGVPQLLKDLQFNEQQDRLDPEYMKFQKDSPITAEVRGKVAQMKLAADGAVKEKLLGNATYQGLTAKADTLAQIGASFLSKQLNREAVQEQEADSMMASLGVEGQRRAALLFPQESKNPIILNSFIKNKENGRELEAVLKAPEREVPNLALRGSNIARELLKRDETQKVGPQTQLLLEEGYRIADDPLKAKEGLKYLQDNGYTKGWSDADIQRAAAATSDIGIKGSKEDKELMQEERARIAKAVMTVKHQAQFDSDMLKLASDKALPAFLVAAQKDPALNVVGKISKQEAINLANRIDDVNIRMQSINELVDFYSSAADKVNKSYLFKVNPMSVEKLKAEAATSRLASFFKPLSIGAEALVTPAAIVGMGMESIVRTGNEFLLNNESPSMAESMRRSVIKSNVMAPKGITVTDRIKKAFSEMGEQ